MIRYTYLNVSATTVEAPKGQGSKGLEDYILNGVFYILIFPIHILHMIQYLGHWKLLTYFDFFIIVALRMVIRDS